MPSPLLPLPHGVYAAKTLLLLDYYTSPHTMHHFFKGCQKATEKTGGFCLVRLAGLEPALPAPEAGALIR
jgi:hypothetical protein